MSKIRGVMLGVVVAMFGVGAPMTAMAGMCGFPGAVVAGANAAGGPGLDAGYVVLFDPATLQQTGVASVRLDSEYGRACMDLIRDSTLGPDATNYMAVFAQSPANGNPIACAQQGCTAAPGSATYCREITLCLALP